MRNRFILAFAFSFFFLVSGTGGLMAQANPEPGQNPTSNMGALKAQVETAGSYSAHSGNATRSILDLSVPGALGDYGLDLVRYWNALRNDRIEANSTFEPDQRTDFGSPGWSHSWGWGAYYAEDSPVVEDGQEVLYITSITITFPDGHANKYKITRSDRRPHPQAPPPDPRCGAPFYANRGENNWVGPGGGVGDHLRDMTEDGSSFWLYRADGGSVHFQLLSGNNWDDYRATEVYDPHGLRTALIYDADGYLQEVVQDGGRKLTFQWDDYDDPPLNRYWPKVIGKVTSSTGSSGTQAVNYGYNWNGWLTLTSVTYQNDPAPGYTSTAVYEYGNYTPPQGFVYGGPLLIKAKDPRYAGPMKNIRYDYALTGCRPPNPQIEPYQGARFDYFYASPTSIAAERDGRTGAYVSRFGIGCFDGTRTEYNGFNGIRKFYYGHSATWPQSGAFGYELAKLTDFSPTFPFPPGLHSRRQSYLNGHPRLSWDGRGIPTQYEHTDGTGFPSEIKHVGSDNTTYRYNRSNPGNSEPPDTTRVPNPADRWLFSKTDERNQTTTYTRDSRRRVKKIDHPDGSYEEFVYDNTLPHSFNQVTSHRLASGATVTYQYDGRGLLQREWNSVEGYAARKEYTYDGLDRVLTMQDGFARRHNKAFSTKTTYNGRHQPLTVEYAATNNSNPIVRYEYDSWGNRTATIDELGHRKDFVYDGYGRCTYSAEQVGPVADCNTVQSRRWDWIYDREIEFGPNSRSNFGASSHTSKEWRIQVEPAFNPAGHRRATARTFDINNRMVSERTGLIQLPGQPLGTLQAGPDTETRRFTYDENGQRRTFTDPKDRVTTYEYDLRNRLKKTIEPLNRTTENSYDTAGNKTLVRFPDNTTQQWLDHDAFGQPRQFKDERQNVTDLIYFLWGPMKKLAQVKTYRAKDGGGTEVQLTAFWHDGMGRLTETIFPDGSYEQSTYEFGQPKTYKTRRGQTKIIDGYDARGRETHHYWLNAQNQIDPATPAIGRIWDDANRMTKIWNTFSTIDYTYDQAGEVRTEGTTVIGGGPLREVRYCRYPNGEVSQITYPNGPTVVNRFYTARGQLSSVGWGSGATSYVYLPDGKVDYQVFTNPNGVTTRYQYDGRGMIQSVSHKNAGGQNLAFREYWRDNRDRILAWKRGSAGGLNGMEDGRGDRYRYDPEGQLEMADYRALYPETTTPQDPKRRDVFHYDQLGNRMGSANVIASWGSGAVSFSRENNGLNQYVDWTRGPIKQDDDMGSHWGAPGQANGVTMQEGWITASYNALNQPRAIWSPSYPNGPSGAQYMWLGFDPLGRCVKRWMGPDTGHAPGSNPATYYYYDGWNLIQEGPGGSTADRTYVHGGRVDEIVASLAAGVWVYHHYDARGHCILLTNASNGSIREQYDYDAFGFPHFYDASGGKLLSSFQFGNRFLFTGREWLKDLRVYDYRNRIYQPVLGRFLQPDPIQFKAGDNNLYRYCHNDPVNRSDPSGLAGTVTADGNNINIDLPFLFVSSSGSDVPDAQSQQYRDGIGGYLTGAFGSTGKFNLNANVHLGARSVTYSSNLITVREGIGASTTVIGTSAHTWHTQLFPGVSTGYIFAHETLHILGLKDLFNPSASGLGYEPDKEGKPTPMSGVDPNNFMVGRGGTGLTNAQIETIVNSNRPTNAAGRVFREVVNAMKNDSGRLAPGNAGTYYNGTIYASGSQAAGVAEWDKRYGTAGSH